MNSGLCITYREIELRYLIDTAADPGVFPRTAFKENLYTSSLLLMGTPISIYDTVTLSLNLDLRRSFIQKFDFAGILKASIGADFITHYDLLVTISSLVL